MHEPLMLHLKNELGRKAIFVVTRDYKDLEVQVANGSIDVGFFPAFSYVEAKANMPRLKLLATVSGRDPFKGHLRDYYQGVILVLKDSGYADIADLQGAKIGFTDIGSSSGYRYPMQLLKEKGVKPDSFFSQMFMLKQHSKVTHALANKVIDVGATWDQNLAKAIEQYGDIFNVIVRTHPIPLDAVAVRPGLNTSLAEKLKGLLLSLKPDDPIMQEMKQLGFPYNGWHDSSDKKYNPVRAVAGVTVNKRQSDRLILGIVPGTDPSLLRKIYQPLVEYLSKQIKRPVELRIARNYGDLATKMDKQAYDVGLFTPYAYVQAKRKLPNLHYLASLQNRSKDGVLYSHYYGVVVALKSSGFQSLDDLRQRKFAFTNRTSTSGYLYPNSLLRDRGIDPEEHFSQTFMLKRHDKIFKALLTQSIDAGASWDGEFLSATDDYGELFQVIEKTQAIPLDAFAAAPHLSDEIVNQLNQALANLEPDSIVIQQMIESGWLHSGITRKDDELYNPIREMIKIQSEQKAY